MQITLVQSDIETALRNYVPVPVTENDEVNVTFKAGRGEQGLIAHVEIAPKGTKAKRDATPKPKSNRGRKPGTKIAKNPDAVVLNSAGPIETKPAPEVVENATAVSDGNPVTTDVYNEPEQEVATDQVEAPATPAKSLFAAN